MSRRGVASGNARTESPEKIWYCFGCLAVKNINLTPSNGWTLEQTNFTATRIVQARACLCKWAWLRKWACSCKRGDAPFRESRRHTQALLEIEDNFDANPENWAADPGEYGFRKVHPTPVRIFLDASLHLYKRVCPSVHRSIVPSVNSRRWRIELPGRACLHHVKLRAIRCCWKCRYLGHFKDVEDSQI